MISEHDLELRLERLEAIASLLGLSEEEIKNEIERTRKAKARQRRIEENQRMKARLASLPESHADHFFAEIRKARFRDNFRRIRAARKAA
jgi:hypothetical protein